MAEYIAREAAVDAVTCIYYDTPEINLTAEKFEAAINGIPAADVAPVLHGHWIRKPHWCVSCSYCGKCTHDYECEVELYNYCPNCGAKMDEGE